MSDALGLCRGHALSALRPVNDLADVLTNKVPLVESIYAADAPSAGSSLEDLRFVERQVSGPGGMAAARTN